MPFPSPQQHHTPGLMSDAPRIVAGGLGFILIPSCLMRHGMAGK